MKTIRYGCNEVEVLQRPWKSGKKVPYKMTNDLRPGESWFDAEGHKEYLQYYVLQDGIQIPAEALVAKELKQEGAIESAFVELWHGCVIVNESLICMSHSSRIGAFIKEVKQLNNNRLGGLPDVIAIFGDGRIALREVKNVNRKDRLRPNQHEMADLLYANYKDRVDLKVVEWDTGGHK